MHELSVATAVLNTAVKHADGRRVKLSGETFNYIGLIGSHRCAGAQVQGCVATTPARFTVRLTSLTGQITRIGWKCRDALTDSMAYGRNLVSGFRK